MSYSQIKCCIDYIDRMNFPSSYQGYFFPAPGIRAYKQVSRVPVLDIFLETSRADAFSVSKIESYNCQCFGDCKKRTVY